MGRYLEDKEIIDIAAEWSKAEGFYEFEKNDFMGCVRELIKKSYTVKPLEVTGNSCIADRVKKIVSEQLGFPREKINCSDRLVEDLLADSLDLLELIIGTEEYFNIEISDEEASKICTVEDIIKYVERK